MSQHTFNTVVGVIFLVVALLHLARIVLGWEATVDGWLVPNWLSIVGILVAGMLSWLAFSEK